MVLILELKLAWNICTFLEENGGANPPFFNEEDILAVGEANRGAVFARALSLLFFGPRIRSGAVTGRVVNGSVGNVYVIESCQLVLSVTVTLGALDDPTMQKYCKASPSSFAI